MRRPAHWALSVTVVVVLLLSLAASAFRSSKERRVDDIEPIEAVAVSRPLSPPATDRRLRGPLRNADDDEPMMVQAESEIDWGSMMGSLKLGSDDSGRILDDTIDDTDQVGGMDLLDPPSCSSSGKISSFLRPPTPTKDDMFEQREEVEKLLKDAESALGVKKMKKGDSKGGDGDGDDNEDGDDSKGDEKDGDDGDDADGEDGDGEGKRRGKSKRGGKSGRGDDDDGEEVGRVGEVSKLVKEAKKTAAEKAKAKAAAKYKAKLKKLQQKLKCFKRARKRLSSKKRWRRLQAMSDPLAGHYDRISDALSRAIKHMETNISREVKKHRYTKDELRDEVDKALHAALKRHEAEVAKSERKSNGNKKQLVAAFVDEGTAPPPALDPSLTPCARMHARLLDMFFKAALECQTEETHDTAAASVDTDSCETRQHMMEALQAKFAAHCPEYTDT